MSTVRTGFTPESRKFVNSEIDRHRSRLRFFSNSLTELGNSARAREDIYFSGRIQRLQEDISLLLGMAMDTGLVTEEMFAQIEGKVQALVSESVSDVRTHARPTPELDAPFEDINH